MRSCRGTHDENGEPLGWPGKELTKLLASYGIEGTKKCGCKAFAAQMDRWGISGCRKRRAVIVDKLRENASEHGWSGKAAMIAEFVGLDPFGKLVDAAIVAAEKGVPQHAKNTTILWRKRVRIPGTQQFNCAMIERQDRRWMVFRRGWPGATIRVVELSADWQPVGEAKEIRFPIVRNINDGKGYWAEDPRTCRFDGSDWVVYAGFNSAFKSTMCLARLNDDFDVVEHIVPKYANRRASEKNWSFFESGAKLHCVYTIAPRHVVLRLDGDVMTEVSSMAWNPAWDGGRLRGGASPVLYGNEWYSFFHGTTTTPKNAPRIWTAGLYTFDATTFEPKRWIPEPILRPDLAERPNGKPAIAVFPCGALRAGDEWVMSYGYFDHHCYVAAWEAAALENRLVPV